MSSAISEQREPSERVEGVAKSSEGKSAGEVRSAPRLPHTPICGASASLRFNSFPLWSEK